eukprot:8180477-Alexandrium_andersonii.AAC.1
MLRTLAHLAVATRCAPACPTRQREGVRARCCAPPPTEALLAQGLPNPPDSSPPGPLPGWSSRP